MITVTRKEALDLKWLKKNHTMIHFFGLGFIQVKVNDQQRVHFYTNRLPATVGLEDIHNHRYDFNSQILRGTLRQWTYDVKENPAGDHFMVQESCNPNNKVETEKVRVKIEETGVQAFRSRSHYLIRHETFHRVYSTDAITLITRTPYKKEFADVVYYHSGLPICPFSVKVPDKELWAIVERMLK